MGEQQDGEDRITPLETDDDQFPSNENHGKDRIPPRETDDDQTPNMKHGDDRISPKKQEIEKNKEDTAPSEKSDSENRIPANDNKRSNRLTVFPELYLEVSAFEDSDEIIMASNGNYKIGVAIGLSS